MCQNHTQESTPCTFQGNSIFSLFRYGISKVTKLIDSFPTVNNLGITLKHTTLKKLHNFQAHTIFIGLSAVVLHSILFLSGSLEKETPLPPGQYWDLKAVQEYK